MKTSPRTILILKIMQVLSWLAIMGLFIQTGAIAYTYGVSFFNPDAARNLYSGLNLYNLSQYSFTHYSAFVLFMIVVLGMKLFMVFLVIKILSRVKMTNPFTLEVAGTIEKISYVLLGTWFITVLNNVYFGLLMERTGAAHEESSGEFFFLAGLVFIIAQVFKRGVEIQSENELTV